MCAETGRRLARAAFKRAVALTPVGTPIVGLAATCALVSDSPKRGQHRCCVVAHTASQVRAPVSAEILIHGPHGLPQPHAHSAPLRLGFQPAH